MCKKSGGIRMSFGKLDVIQKFPFQNITTRIRKCPFSGKVGTVQHKLYDKRYEDGYKILAFPKSEF